MYRLFVAISILCLVVVGMSCGNNTKSAQQQQQESNNDIRADIRTDSITEVLVEFGDVARSTLATKKILLYNTTDTTLSFVDYKATCRCTWIDLPTRAIAPGGTAEATLKFDSRGEYGSIGNYLDIRTSDPRCRVGIWMSAYVK